MVIHMTFNHQIVGSNPTDPNVKLFILVNWKINNIYN